MAKIVSITISVLILLQSFHIGIGEIIEMDELVEHAQFHAEEYGDNFIVFLSKHYGELKAEHNKQHREEQKEHESLPFNHQMHTFSLSVFVLNGDTNFDATTQELVTNTQSEYYYFPSDSSFEDEGPFQPPRQA
tara:strand:- start:6218 stop:6619 length:402 start_codon:yes stop_codon:yes gene_type:complete